MGQDDKSTLEHRTGTRGPVVGGERVSLVLFHRDGAKVVPLYRDKPVVVGRAWPADAVLEDPSLSRKHAEFVWEDAGVFVLDLGDVRSQADLVAPLGAIERVRRVGLALDYWIEVDTSENDTSVHGCGAQCQINLLAGMQANASCANDIFQGSLPDHATCSCVVIGSHSAPKRQISDMFSMVH